MKHSNENLENSLRRYLNRQMSRREFLLRASALGLSLSGLGRLIDGVLAQENGQSSSEIAAETAREKYEGETLTVVWEEGLQAQDPLLFSGSLWEEATGVKLNIVEVPMGTELFDRQLAAHIVGDETFDVLSIAPSWLADYVLAGVVEPIDAFIEEYMVPEDLEDLIETYRGLANFEDQIYGLFDDGDTILLYYRLDLFDEFADEFADTFGYPLLPPTNWKQFDEIARFFTEKLAPEVYGAAFGRAPDSNWPLFIPHFKANGGTFFEPNTMIPLIDGNEGVRTVAEMAHSNRWMPPNITELTNVDTFQEWLKGNYAMTYFWPPLGRWSAGYGQRDLDFLPESLVVGKTGYALLPGDITQMAVGYLLSVAADSPNKELAYLFIQWINSPEISLQRVTLPFALRDPFRISHFESDVYRSLWPNAGDYLDTLLEAARKASFDLIIPGAQRYHDALDQACIAVYEGADSDKAMEAAAETFDGITNRLGRERQQQAYANYLQMSGAYPSANLVDAPSNIDEVY
jgi:multiple sugar transport system substrate-binding protein